MKRTVSPQPPDPLLIGCPKTGPRCYTGGRGGTPADRDHGGEPGRAGERGGAGAGAGGDVLDPAYVAFEPGNLERVYVVELGGTVRVTEGGSTSTFLDLNADADLVLSGGERGLFSIAFAPDYESSGHFYAYYAGTVAAGGDAGDLHIDEFRTGPDPAATLASRRPVLTIGHAAHDNHNGGQLQFGPTAICTRAPVTAAAAAIRSRPRRTRARCSARSCASTRAGTERPPIRSPRTTRSSGERERTRCGATGFVTRGDSRSTARPADC